MRYIFFSLMVIALLSCSDSPPVAENPDTAMQHAIKHTDPTYVCPMHPQIVKNEEGSCPICGMDLVLTKAPAPQTEDTYPEVNLSGTVIQLMGVKTVDATKGTLWKHITTIGKIEYDETRLTHVHPRAEGWVETLNIRAEGDLVAKNTQLGKFYSPEILAAQVDFLIALKDTSNGNHANRMRKARNRLRLYGVPKVTIQKIERTRQSIHSVPIFAPTNGIITMLGAREGMYLTPTQELFTIADLSRVWVQVDVYENQLSWVRQGLDAEIKVPAYPEKVWKGKLEYLYPELDSRSRTLKVRLVFDNPEGQLKPNMFANAVIYGGARHNVLNIPKQALIVTGERQSVVIALGEGRFQPVDVQVGMRQGDKVEITSGLKEGDKVVVSGQFLIDSESNLQASYLRLAE